MIHDSGIAIIYRVKRDETAPPPSTATLEELGRYYFGDRTVGTTRFYEAAQAGMRVDRVIEIWRDEYITTRDLCRIGEQYYLIQRIEQGEDYGLLITRLTLELSDGAVWEGSSHADQG